MRIEYASAAYVLAPETAWIHFDDGPGQPLRCKVAAVKSAEGGVVVLAAGVTRDTVARLRGAVVLADAPAPPCGRLPVADKLIGMRLVSQDGAPLGAVVGVLEGPAGDVVRVERPDGGMFLLPVVEPAVVAVDVEAHVLTVLSDLSAFAVDEP